MPITLENDAVSESRKSGNGHNGNGHGVRERVNSKARAGEDDSMMVLQEIMRLVDASKDGRLSERAKATLFNGVHREMLQGVNEMLDAILLPIGEGNRILAQISNGKIDELIAQSYKGDHEKMKVAVNNVAIVTQGLQKELARSDRGFERRPALRPWQAGAVPGRVCRDCTRRQHHAGCDSSADRRG